MENSEDRNGSVDEPVQPPPGNNPSPFHFTFNPSVTDDMLEDIADKIKGDAIGDTLYSSRFVLKTLIKLTKMDVALSSDEPFETDLCALWDMTIEKDVVKLLLDHNVLELFAAIIKVTEDQRLTEILVGIIGNMCALTQTRDVLCNSPELVVPLLELTACSDSLILIQLMRFLHAALVFENAGDELMWFQHFNLCKSFVPNFAFILTNSMSTTLLLSAFEALNSICTKFAIIEIQPDNNRDFRFRDNFVQPILISGVIEAFKQVLPYAEETDEVPTPTNSSQRFMSLFLDIHVILSQYDEVSHASYAPFKEDLFLCMSQILEPLCQPFYLFPLTTNEQGFIENVNEIFQTLGDPFDKECFSKMLRIWAIIDGHSKNRKNPIDSDWEAHGYENEEETADCVNPDDFIMTILDFITRTCKNATFELITQSIIHLNVRNVVNLYKALSAGDAEPDIKDCCSKLKAVAQIVWNIDISEAEQTDDVVGR